MPRNFASRHVTMGDKRTAYERATRYPGQSTLVDPAPTRAHVLDLMAQNMTVYSIARDAGLSDTAVSKLINNEHDRIRIRHAEALQAVTCHPNPRQVRVLSIGAARRLRALAAIGWSWIAIANRTGLNQSSLSTIANDGRTTITWDMWCTIRDAYETLSGTPATGPVASRMRRNAMTKAWAAPLDLEGHDIDDPRINVTADPWKPKTAREIAAERALVVAELTAKGLSAKEVAQRVGITPRQVVRDRGATAVAAA